MTDTDKLVEFLRNCIRSIENKTITYEQKIALSEFYTRFLFQESNVCENMNDKDALKYLSMGWYIYSELRNNNHQ